MQQADAPDVSGSIPLIISLQRPYSPSYVQKIDSTSEDDSNNTNSFANLARAAGRVEGSECDKWTRMMSRNRSQ
eukprot:3465142-Pyramimonas_sp.AAC.1